MAERRNPRLSAFIRVLKETICANPRLSVSYFLLALGALLLLIWGVIVGRAGFSLLVHLREATALAARAGESVPDPDALCGLVRNLRADVATLTRHAGWVARLASLLGWVPGVGGDLRAAPHLLATADHLTRAGVLTCDALSPAFGLLDQGINPSALEKVLPSLAAARPVLEQALGEVEQAIAAWERVDRSALSPRVASRLALLDRALPLLRVGLSAAWAAPDLLGADGPRTYLILAQNEDELRPTGGFISGVARLTLERGKITDLVFHDANLVDDYARKPYPEPPEPLLHYMGSELWLFRDANWSPDFPTSARQIAYFYEYGQDVSVDGVFALDQYAIELLMHGLGEVHIPGAPEPIRARNVREFMRAAWNPPTETGVTEEWIFSRKSFMQDIGLAILQRIEENPGSIDWLKVGKGIYQALEERHLLLFIDNPDLARVLAGTGWDGALRRTSGDYVMVVDANVGFGKVNPLVRREMRYQVALQRNGAGNASLSLTYVHQGQREGIRCQHRFEYTGDLTYEEMMHRCYYNYLRVYVPEGSRLRFATPHFTPGEYLLRGMPDSGQAIVLGDELGKTVFAQFFVVEYGQILTTRFEYELPDIVRTSNGEHYYSLWLQKQPGTRDFPVSVSITLPPSARWIAAHPTPQSVSHGTLGFEFKMDTDVFIEVVYEFPEG